MEKIVFFAIFSNFEAEARVVDLKISKSRRTKVVSNDLWHLLSTQAQPNFGFEISPYKNEPA
jgi:hypothetical protein